MDMFRHMMNAGMEKNFAQEEQEKKTTINKLLEAKQDIQDLGHEFADALREMFGENAAREQLGQSQRDFLAAVSRCTGLTLKDIHRVGQDMDFLNMHYYMAPEEEDEHMPEKEAIQEVYQANRVGDSKEVRALLQASGKQAFEEMMGNKKYQNIASSRAEVKAFLGEEYEQVDAALRSLREISLEAEQQLRGLEDVRLQELVDRIERALTHASIAPYLSKPNHPITRGVGEIITQLIRARVEEASGWNQTIHENEWTYSCEGTVITRQARIQEIEEQLSKPKQIMESARTTKDYYAEKALRFQLYDAFFREWKRYIKHGPLPAIDITGQDIYWRTLVEEDLDQQIAQIRAIVQSVPKEEALQLYAKRKTDIMATLEKKTQKDRPKQFETMLLEILKKHEETALGEKPYGQTAKERGRDSMEFIERDLHRHIIKYAQRAKQPLPLLEQEVRQRLQTSHDKHVAFIDALEDMEDLAANPRLLAQLKEQERRAHFNSGAVDELTSEIIKCEHVLAQEKERSDPNSYQHTWLEAHPLNHLDTWELLKLMAEEKHAATA